MRPQEHDTGDQKSGTGPFIAMGEEAHRGSPLAALAGLIVWPQVLSRFKRKKLGQTNGFECPGPLVSLLIITSVLRAQSGLGGWLDMVPTQAARLNPPGGPSPSRMVGARSRGPWCPWTCSGDSHGWPGLRSTRLDRRLGSNPSEDKHWGAC